MTAAESDTKKCQECGTRLFGRVDKKFCSDQCRNLWNNRENKVGNDYVRKVTAILKKNRKILAEMNPGGKKKASKEELLRRGFNFEYFTNIYITKKEKKEYRYCYDQGYFEMSPGWLLLVHRIDLD